MRYHQLASHAYCGATGPVSKMASQQEKAFCVLRFEVSRSVITVQREFLAHRAEIRNDCTFILFCLQLKHIGLNFKAFSVRDNIGKSISFTDYAVFKYINFSNLDISSGWCHSVSARCIVCLRLYDFVYRPSSYCSSVLNKDPSIIFQMTLKSCFPILSTNLKPFGVANLRHVAIFEVREAVTMKVNYFPEFDAMYSCRHVLYKTTRHGILEVDDILT
jgi:hypothetical protein